jgi:hypothetical protein
MSELENQIIEDMIICGYDPRKRRDVQAYWEKRLS